MKLFLTSYAARSFDKIIPLLPQSPTEYSVLFVPTAANMYDDPPWVRADRDKLLSLGFRVNYFDIEGSNENEVTEELDKNDIIFVAGGNTFYLLEHAQKSGFAKLVTDTVRQGKIYIGSSAGSVIAGPDIEPVDEFDDPKEADVDTTKGFGLVDFIVLPHYRDPHHSREYEKVMKKYAEKYSFTPLSDEQIVVVEGSTSKII